MKFINPWFKSLRARYLFVTISLMGSVIALVIMANQYITDSSQARFNNIENRLIVSRVKDTMRNNLDLASRKLDLYLIEPALAHRFTFKTRTDTAIKQAKSLSESPWIISNQLQDTVLDIKNTLTDLQKHASTLMQLRLDANAMYPALQAANNHMLQANLQIIGSLGYAIDELLVDTPNQAQLLSYLVSARDSWRRTILAYRLYIINRMGSLFESALSIQTKNILDNHEDVRKYTRLLLEYAERNSDLPLNTEVAIDTLVEQNQLWSNAFNDVVNIKSSNEWRRDVPIITQNIFPMLDKVHSQLAFLDEQLNSSSANDIQAQHHASDNISYALWYLFGVIFLISLFCYFILDRSLLKPIALISKSLRNDYQENMVDVLPSVKSKEMMEFVSAFSGMQDQIKARQIELTHTATHDALTTLPNRVLLMKNLQQCIVKARKNNDQFALLIMDLNRFKEVNDTLGHSFGDALLCEVAYRLKKLVRQSDFVARLGGDEFAMILTGINDNTVDQVCKSICCTLEEVYTINDHNLYLGASIGISIYPKHGYSTVNLLKNADIAMYNAKNSNSSYEIYEADKNVHNIQKLNLLSDLRIAVERNELFMEFQPIYSIQQHAILGFEALIRWNHPTLNIVYPKSFIDTAEQTGLIRKITYWVIDQALYACKQWHKNNPEIYVSINITSWDLHESMVNVIQSALNKYNLPPSSLVLELTERSVMTESITVRHTLEMIHKMGIHFAMDDFGTGFSSMTYLQQLPIQLLKIDQSFVMHMSEQKSDALIVKSIIELAHNLNLRVVAEGVETENTLDSLSRLNCDCIQGNFFSRPLSQKKALRLIDSMTLEFA